MANIDARTYTPSTLVKKGKKKKSKISTFLLRQTCTYVLTHTMKDIYAEEKKKEKKLLR